jgi:Tfp pilus assembly PilM family ATPase
MGKKKQSVSKALVFDTPRAAMEDGYIRDYGLFAEQLLLQFRVAKIKPKNVVFTISSNKVVSREVTITAAKEKLLKNIVEAEIGDYCPMDLSEHSSILQLCSSRMR